MQPIVLYVTSLLPTQLPILTSQTPSHLQLPSLVAGKYSGWDSTWCYNCQEGKFSDERGSSVCKIAPPGKKPANTRTEVIPCPAGTWSIGGVDECTECESGKYSSDSAFTCTAARICGAGERIFTPSTTTSDTICEDCPAGKASSGVRLQVRVC